MTILFSLILVLCLAVAAVDWKKGLYACVVAALAQDPLRKLILGEPVYLTVTAAAVFGLAIFSAAVNGVPLRLQQIKGWKRGLGLPFTLLILWILLQTIYSLFLYHSPIISALGLLSYVAPIPALVIGYQFALRSGAVGIVSWMRFYVALVVILLVSVFLEYLGVETKVFGQVGSDMLIYDLGTILIGKSGLFRSSEIAAWHATTAACFILIVIISKRLTTIRVAIALAMLALFVGVAILTGRRKSIVLVLLFLSAYIFLFAIFFKTLQHWISGAIVVCAAALLLSGTFIDFDDTQDAERTSEYRLFVERGATVFEDLPDRIRTMGIGQLEWAARTSGYLGAGVGAATSSARFFKDQGNQLVQAGEGGLGKVMVELGLPGLALFCWLFYALARHIWRILQFTALRSSRNFRISCAMVAFLLVQGANYFIGTQIFSDFFVLIALGLTTGFLLVMPQLSEHPVDAVSRKQALEVRKVQIKST